MIVIGGGLLGIALGAYSASKRGGNRWDIAQYAAVYGIACMLLGLFITIFIHRMAV